MALTKSAADILLKISCAWPGCVATTQTPPVIIIASYPCLSCLGSEECTDSLTSHTLLLRDRRLHSLRAGILGKWELILIENEEYLDDIQGCPH